MKKVFCVFAAAVMALSVAACSSPSEKLCDESLECAKSACKDDACKKEADKAHDKCLESVKKVNDKSDCSKCGEVMDDYAECALDHMTCDKDNGTISKAKDLKAIECVAHAVNITNECSVKTKCGE